MDNVARHWTIARALLVRLAWSTDSGCPLVGSLLLVYANKLNKQVASNLSAAWPVSLKIQIGFAVSPYIDGSALVEC